LALKVQRKVSNGVAGLAAGDHLWIGRKSRQFLPLSDRPTPAQASPSLTPQLKRE
jgi:hypothetical protein